MTLRILICSILCLVLTGCKGCSKSAQKNKNRQERTSSRDKPIKKNPRTTKGSIIKMKKRNGVYYVPVYLNGIKMDFVFDTGASVISISEKEANLMMKQGTLSKTDIRGTSNFSDATGEVSVGTVINLKTVKIGNVTLRNIKASIVHNEVAPLLLGQSAFEEFGKISIDYKKDEITLE